MKKILLLLSVALLSALQMSAQVFLNSPAYVYGSAVSQDETRADSLALVSLARAVNVRISAGPDGKIRMDSPGGFDMNGIRRYSRRKGRNCEVYYYINKQEYIEDQLKEYNECISTAEFYKESATVHAKNLALGYYYLAWKAASSGVMQSLYPDAEHLATNALELIRDTYNHMGYFLSARNVGATTPSKIILVRDENAKVLPGFEYKDFNGRWVTPTQFCDHDAEPCTDIGEAKWAYVDNTDKEFRFRFEILVGGELVKIDVPEEFYYLSGRVMHFF